MESTVQPVSLSLFHTTDWDAIAPTHAAGLSGTATYRVVHYEGFRMRLVEYSAGYEADHWCNLGHIVFCLEGEMTSQLDDGRHFILKPGMSYVVANEASNHRSVTTNGAKVLIVDGKFLHQKKDNVRNPWRM
jgi:quercetin dioxygenase-like cupin family protein